jgi:colanic acid/amylovoran biosynthesis glycosyltransferase
MDSDRQPTAREVAGFYDSFTTHLLADFVHGNPRAELAIAHALAWLPRGTRRALDIGCGIGWSSWEIKRHHPAIDVVGIDFSARMVALANTLFAAPGLAFRSVDISRDLPFAQGNFEAVAMLDVYEHIARHQRKALHLRLAEVLAEESRVILTVPTASHQQRLRTRDPNRLQPIDEDVSLEDFERLAQDLGARLRMVKEVSVWNPGDYMHAVIERGSFPQRIAHPERRTHRLAPRRVRAAIVRRVLSKRVTRDGLMLPDVGRMTVCVVSPSRDAYSETFIRAHVERLPARVEVLTGGWLPTHAEDGTPLLRQDPVARLMRATGRRVLRLASGYLETRAVVHFLKRRRITAVLCEYGPTGVMCYPACRTARVPLIVHFHGFDAYDRTTLDSFGRSYPQLFEAASAIVAVSRHMEQTLLDLGAPRKKLHYNPYGVDTKVFRGAEPAAVPPRFLSVGRFVDKKAPHLTVLAFSLVAREVPEAQLTMIGGGPLMEASRQLARALRIGERVDFVGPQPPLDVAAAMRRSRAFVQHSVVTSYGDSEGTPVAILEAGASGLPVVATRHRGIADVVVDGTTGFLVDELDVDAMAERMLRLATDAQLADRLGRAGREHVASNYLVEDRIASLWQIISGTIEARR